MLECVLQPGTYTLIPAEDKKLSNVKYIISIRSSKPLQLRGEQCNTLPTPGFEKYVRYCITNEANQTTLCGLGMNGFQNMN